MIAVYILLGIVVVAAIVYFGFFLTLAMFEDL